MMHARWFNGGYKVRIAQVPFVYAICCTVTFCIWDGDNFVFATHDRWLVVVLDSLDGFNIEVIYVNLSNTSFLFLFPYPIFVSYDIVCN